VLGHALTRTEASNRGFMAVASSRVHPDATPVYNTPIRSIPHPESAQARRARSGLYRRATCSAGGMPASSRATWCLGRQSSPRFTVYHRGG